MMRQLFHLILICLSIFQPDVAATTLIGGVEVSNCATAACKYGYYIYDFETGTTQIVDYAGSSEPKPWIGMQADFSGNKAAFMKMRYDKRVYFELAYSQKYKTYGDYRFELSVMDLDTGRRDVVAEFNGRGATNPRVDGDYAVYREGTKSGLGTLILYDFRTGAKTALVRDTFDYEIGSYDLSGPNLFYTYSHRMHNYASAEVNQKNPLRIYRYDIPSGSTQELLPPKGVWRDYRVDGPILASNHSTNHNTFFIGQTFVDYARNIAESINTSGSLSLSGTHFSYLDPHAFAGSVVCGKACPKLLAPIYLSVFEDNIVYRLLAANKWTYANIDVLQTALQTTPFAERSSVPILYGKKMMYQVAPPFEVEAHMIQKDFSGKNVGENIPDNNVQVSIFCDQFVYNYGKANARIEGNTVYCNDDNWDHFRVGLITEAEFRSLSSEQLAQRARQFKLVSQYDPSQMKPTRTSIAFTFEPKSLGFVKGHCGHDTAYALIYHEDLNLLNIARAEPPNSWLGVLPPKPTCFDAAPVTPAPAAPVVPAAPVIPYAPPAVIPPVPATPPAVVPGNTTPSQPPIIYQVPKIGKKSTITSIFENIGSIFQTILSVLTSLFSFFKK